MTENSSPGCDVPDRRRCRLAGPVVFGGIFPPVPSSTYNPSARGHERRSISLNTRPLDAPGQGPEGRGAVEEGKCSTDRVTTGDGELRYPGRERRPPHRG